MLVLFLVPCRGLADAKPGTEQWYLATVDHYESGYYALLVEFPDAGLAVRRLDLMVLGLGAPDRGHLRHETESYNRVDALENYRVVVDELSRRIHFVRRGDSHVGTPQSNDLLLTAQINRRRIDQPVLVRFRDGEFYLPGPTLRTLGVDPDAVGEKNDSGDISMHAVAGENFTVDPRNLELIMTVPPAHLETTVIGVDRQGVGKKPQTSFSSILDYRVTGGEDGNGEPWSAARAGLSISSGTSLCRSEHLYRSQQERVDRLESLCLLDFPEKLFSVSLGDQITGAGSFGQPLRYGGIRLGTDFSLAPEFVTQPTLGLTGSARVPSMLEIWTNQALLVSREIPPGPFRITELPAQTGAGELRAVVDDGSGVPTVMKRPFYSDPSLLADGLLEWSLEGGRKRLGMLTEEDRYEERFGVLSARYGATDWLTLASRAEYQRSLGMASASGHLRLAQLGVLKLGGAGSRTEDGLSGQAATMGFSHRNGRFSFGYDETLTGEDFVQLGYEEPGSAPARDRRLTLGANLGHHASVTLGRVRREFRGQQDQRFNSVSLSLPFFHRGSLQLNAFDVREPEETRFYGIQITVPLGSHENFSLGAEGEELENRQLTLQRNLPAGPGVGYRISGGQAGEQESASGDLVWRNQQALLRLHGQRLGDYQSAFAEVSGSVIGAGGLHLAPTSSGSYGLVELGEPGVGIFHENRPVGVTDDGGRLLVPGLRPYEQNRLSLAPEDLSLGTQARQTRVTMVPGRRQVLEADFGTTRDRYLSARVERTDGSPVPAGALVHVRGGEQESVIGRGGLLYVPVPAGGTLSARVEWRHGQCRLETRLPGTGEALVNGGTLICQ